MSAVIRYRILGPVELRPAHGDWQHIPRGKWRTLLAILLVRANRAVPSDDLRGQLWPENVPGTARKIVHQYVHCLRQILDDPYGEILCTRPGGYELRVRPGELDSDHFATLSSAGRHALAGGSPAEASADLGRALELWRGSAMANVTDTPAIAAERVRLNERRLAALEAWLRAGLACGRHEMVIPELESLVVAHPLREHFRELLMTALYETGRQADALAVARDLRSTLREELGVDPGIEVQRLERAILVGTDPNLAPLRRPLVLNDR